MTLCSPSSSLPAPGHNLAHQPASTSLGPPCQAASYLGTQLLPPGAGSSHTPPRAPSAPWDPARSIRVTGTWPCPPAGQHQPQDRPQPPGSRPPALHTRAGTSALRLCGPLSQQPWELAVFTSQPAPALGSCAHRQPPYPAAGQHKPKTPPDPGPPTSRLTPALGLWPTASHPRTQFCWQYQWLTVSALDGRR